jgi:hypothetical protein
MSVKMLATSIADMDVLGCLGCHHMALSWPCSIGTFSDQATISVGRKNYDTQSGHFCIIMKYVHAIQSSAIDP